MELIHKAIRLLNENELIVVSTDRQIKNGTIMVEDSHNGVRYTVHVSGYARKRVVGWMGPNHYQLNKTKFIYKEWTDSHNKTYKVKQLVRILLPGEYLQLAQMVINSAKRQRKRKTTGTIF